MIFTDRVITIRKGQSIIDEPIIVYRGDYEITVKFTIVNSKFRFLEDANIINSENASFGQLAILTPYGGNVFSDVSECVEGTVTFIMTAEMLDQIEEVGLYSFQIRLFGENSESRVTIPPIEFGLEVREPIASEDHDNTVNNAIVGYAIANIVDPSTENVGDTFNTDGDYNKTEWGTGDRISQGKLNKIEDAIDVLNKNDKSNMDTLSTRLQSNYNVLSSELNDLRSDTTSNLNTLRSDTMNDMNENAINVKQFEDLVVSGDWTNAFKTAIYEATVNSHTYRRVYIPAGEYEVQGVILPSNVELIGAGKGHTILRLIPGDLIDSKYKQCLVTNEDWINGNTNIKVKDMTLDWNNAYSTILKNPGSTSCLFANCHDSIMENIHACGGGLHGLDIANNRYNPFETVVGNEETVYYLLDANGNVTDTVINPATYKREYRSTNCKIIGCSATGAIDDNITTHHSDLITISNCISYDPIGREGGANTNCFEIDDGSTRVTVDNCYAYGGRCGFEVKGHDTSPAANNVILNNCIAEKNVFGYRIRHIGHRSGEVNTENLGDSESAFNVNVNNCVSVNPTRNEIIAPNVTPNAFKLYAYRDVNITNLICIGGDDGIYNGEYDEEDTDDEYSGSEVIRLTSGGRNINLSNISIRNFKQCEQAIYISGGGGGSKININNVDIVNSGRKGIRMGANTYANINNLRIDTSNDDAEIGVLTENRYCNLLNCFITGYPTNFVLGDVSYSTAPAKLNGGTVIAGGLGHAIHDNSCVIASTAGATASGDKSIVISSSECKSEGARSAVISSNGASTNAAGERVTIASSTASTITASTTNSAILASTQVVNSDSNAVCGGYGTTQSSANKTWQINSITGDILASGTLTGSSTFSDFAEMFENKVLGEIETGMIVALDGDKVVKANGCDILGVISKTAVLVAGDTSFTWASRYMTDEFGGIIYEEVEVQNEGDITCVSLPKENPDFDITKVQVPRSERKDEWSCVGLIGQVHVRVDDTVQVGDNIKANNGVGTKSDEVTRLRAMRITKEFDGNYGVALCLLR